MVMSMMMTKTMASDWGTWEELLLGGAVLRHGTGDWSVVADELRSHSLPLIFTPQICKAKYKDLRKRYLGCKAWFEELKKKRVAELKAALLKSEDSIGSLESKLQSLRSESNDNDYYDSSRTVSLEPSLKSEGGGECTSKDLSSAGSFTQQDLTTTTTWSPEQAPAITEEHRKTTSNLLHNDLLLSMYGVGQVLPSMRKKRGKRKRKEVISTVEETRLFDSSASTSSGHGLALPEELMEIYNVIAQNECALVFTRRLDSQKRGRYKKLVRRHMDLDTIRSRIGGCLIFSAKELFMEFLLVANNAAVFYHKNTREHRSAVCLRDIVTKSLRQYLSEDHGPHRRSVTTTSREVMVSPCKSAASPVVQTGKKPRTGAHHVKMGAPDMVKTLSGGRKRFATDSPVKLSAAGKKGTAIEKTGDGRQVNRRLDPPALVGRKRSRVR